MYFFYKPTTFLSSEHNGISNSLCTMTVIIRLLLCEISDDIPAVKRKIRKHVSELRIVPDFVVFHSS